MNHTSVKDIKARRIFVRSEGQAFQMFDLHQKQRDGSIYFSSPEFSTIEWQTLQQSPNGPQVIKLNPLKEGHLSFHGLGTAHITPSEMEHLLPIQGQHLLRVNEKEISLRHLFTAFFQKPTHVPISQALNRQSDYVIDTTNLRPVAMVAFALPRVGLNVNFQCSFSMDDLDTIPGMDGFGTFNLVHHDIFWFVYHTKYMTEWPEKTLLQYGDGIIVPLLMEITPKQCRIDFRMPQYNFDGKNLEINLNATATD